MKIEMNISDEILESTLISGLEGGSNYWCAFEGSSPGEDYYFEKILGDGWVELTDINSDKTYRLDRAKVINGLQVMLKESPNQFSNMLKGNGDAWTGDTLIQCCLLGEVIYG